MKSFLNVSLVFASFFLLTACSQQSTGSVIDTSNIPPSQEEEMFIDLQSGTYEIGSESKVKWAANKVVGGHWGYFPVASGEVIVEEGEFVDGSFVLDMASLTIEDTDNQGLLDHLKSEDFFNVDNFSTSEFEITSLKSLEGDASYNFDVIGNLTLLGLSNEVHFPAFIDFQDDLVTVQASFVINRTDWGLTYRSGNFFENLGDKMIKDEVPLELDLEFVRG